MGVRVAVFAPGSFGITRFQVATSDSTVYPRATLAALTPAFGVTWAPDSGGVTVSGASARP